eukprot:TRINITY_DN621_c2_g1_i3.p2 TRINITY_DN621_c2_g1~~TRINITY_DN621_c2_g1_i3.p2  ORF type:complete len:218 (+),score=-11.02 TRINITY_DN621_c2_g1_i3:584-1237(+)
MQFQYKQCKWRGLFSNLLTPSKFKLILVISWKLSNQNIKVRQETTQQNTINKIQLQITVKSICKKEASPLIIPLNIKFSAVVSNQKNSIVRFLAVLQHVYVILVQQNRVRLFLLQGQQQLKKLKLLFANINQNMQNSREPNHYTLGQNYMIIIVTYCNNFSMQKQAPILRNFENFVKFDIIQIFHRNIYIFSYKNIPQNHQLLQTVLSIKRNFYKKL